MPQVTVTAAAADDGSVARASAAWPPAGPSNYTMAGVEIQTVKSLFGTDYYVYNGLVRFDTGAVIPDTATVTAVTFRGYITYLVNGDARSLSADYFTWAGTGDPGDWTAVPGTDAHAGTALSSLTALADNDLALANVGGGNVSVSGYTYLRWHISGAAPAGDNSLNFAANEHTTATEPRLIVTFSVPATRIAPDAILAQTNLTGAVSVIQDDPDSPDANWLTAP